MFPLELVTESPFTLMHKFRSNTQFSVHLCLTLNPSSAPGQINIFSLFVSNCTDHMYIFKSSDFFINIHNKVMQRYNTQSGTCSLNIMHQERVLRKKKKKKGVSADREARVKIPHKSLGRFHPGEKETEERRGREERRTRRTERSTTEEPHAGGTPGRRNDL